MLKTISIPINLFTEGCGQNFEIISANSLSTLYTRCQWGPLNSEVWEHVGGGGGADVCNKISKIGDRF
jgi:hypothetical protein